MLTTSLNKRERIFSFPEVWVGEKTKPPSKVDKLYHADLHNIIVYIKKETKNENITT